MMSNGKVIHGRSEGTVGSCDSQCEGCGYGGLLAVVPCHMGDVPWAMAMSQGRWPWPWPLPWPWPWPSTDDCGCHPLGGPAARRWRLCPTCMNGGVSWRAAHEWRTLSGTMILGWHLPRHAWAGGRSASGDFLSGCILGPAPCLREWCALPGGGGDLRANAGNARRGRSRCSARIRNGRG
jgi:hypothetical protein